MIVYPQALVGQLAATPFPLTHGRIGYQTYTRGAVPSQVTVSSEVVGFPADAPLRPETHEAWQPTVLPATWQFNIGTLQDVNYAGLAGHNLGSAGVSIKAETSMDGVAWTALAPEHIPSDDAPIMLLDSMRQSFHIRFTFAGAGIVMPKVASIFVGKTLDLYRPIYGGHSPLQLSRDTVLQSAVSQGGQFIGQVIQRMGVQGNVSLKNLPASWYRSDFDPFVEATLNYPYFYAWRPLTFPLESAYVWNTDDITPSNSGKRDTMEVTLKVRGIGWVRNG